MSRIPIRRAKATLRSDEFPARNLVYRDERDSQWRTDAPTQRVSLVIDLGNPKEPPLLRPDEGFRISAFRVVCYGATHVDICCPVVDEAAVALGGTIPSTLTMSTADNATLKRGETLVHRTELVSMFLYKGLMAENSKHAIVVDKTLTVVPTSPSNVKTCIVTLLGLWEPYQRLGLESIEVYGVASSSSLSIADSSSAVGVKMPVAATPSPSAVVPSMPKKRPRAVEEEPILLSSASGAWPTAIGSSGGSPSSSTIAAISSSSSSGSPSVAPAPPSPVVSAASDPDAASVKPLRGCVLVLSGFVNPLRAEVRDKGISLGAKVKNDWDAECTHLIASIANTPKYRQMASSGHGMAVSKEWVLHAFLAKKRPLETPYLMGGAGAPALTTTGASITPPPPPPAPPSADSGDGKPSTAHSPFRFVM